MLKRLAIIALLLPSAAISSIAVVHAAAQPALLTISPGTWSCAYTGPHRMQRSTVTFSTTNAGWLLVNAKSGAYGKMPAHANIGLIGYDSKTGQYVSFGGSSMPGDWSVSTAKASPSSVAMTFVNNYPADPTNERDNYTFTPSKVAYTSTWTEKGKPMRGSGTCTKQ